MSELKCIAKAKTEIEAGRLWRTANAVLSRDPSANQRSKIRIPGKTNRPL